MFCTKCGKALVEHPRPSTYDRHSGREIKHYRLICPDYKITWLIWDNGHTKILADNEWLNRGGDL